MKIVRLTAENIKRLRAVEITPDGNTVVISGRNGQGKTSVLDAIWLALGGGTATKDTATSRPIRDGEDRASVTVDLGDLKVTRTWAGDKTALKVQSADGASYSSPQSMLDSLVGRLSFDPLAFAQQDEKAQLRTLLELVDIDPTLLDNRRRAIFDERTDVNRRHRELLAQVAALPLAEGGLPDVEVSLSELLDEAQKARAWQDRAQRIRDDHAAAEGAVERARTELALAEAALAETAAAVAKIPATLPDPAALDEQIRSAEDTNRKVRAAAERSRLQVLADETGAEAKELTEQIDAIDAQKAEAIRNAEMPIDGLGFDDDGVTYQGVPFKQCSAAEQLRVSVAMAMAMNPKIRVIRITDGSLLDSQNLALIEDMAADGDFQVWIEKVDETGDVGIYIEDGSVVRSPEPVLA